MCRKQEVILCSHFLKPITFIVTNPDWSNVLTNEQGNFYSLYQGHCIYFLAAPTKMTLGMRLLKVRPAVAISLLSFANQNRDK